MAVVGANQRTTERNLFSLFTGTILICWVAFVVGFWIFFVLAMVASYGIFDWVGYDYAPFWAAGRAVLLYGPAASYDLDTLARLAQPLTAALGPKSTGLAVAPGLYPPIFFVLLAPFALLPGPMSFVLWTVTQVALAVYVVGSLATRFHARRILIAIGSFFFFPLTLVFFFGQSTVLPLVALHEAYRNFERGREFRAGLWLGTLFIKPQYALIFPLILLYKRRWRALGGMVAVLIPLALTTLLFLGPEGLENYRALSNSYSGFRHNYLSVHPQDMINRRGVLVNLFPDLSESGGQALTLGLSALTATLLFPVWRGRWEPTGQRFPVQILATTLIVLLTAYHSHIHGAALLLVPGMVVVARDAGSRILRWTLCSGLFALPLCFAVLLAAASLSEAWKGVLRASTCFLVIGLVVSMWDFTRVPRCFLHDD